MSLMMLQVLKNCQMKETAAVIMKKQDQGDTTDTGSKEDRASLFFLCKSYNLL